MAQFLRRLSNIERWAEVYGSPDAFDADIPDHLLSAEYDARGISVFRVSSEEEVKRVAATMILSMSPKDFYGVLIDEKKLNHLGARTEKSDGAVFDREVEKWHYDIRGLSLKQVSNYMKLLLGLSKTPYILTVREAVSYVNNQLSRGAITRNDVFRKSEKLRYGELIIGLWKKELLSLIEPGHRERAAG